MNDRLRRWHASRLKPLLTDSDLRPFFRVSRAKQIIDCSLYWVPVATFPVPLLQKEWLEQFLRRLAAGLKTDYALREEWFLQSKALHQKLLYRFTERANKYCPMMGMTLAPGSLPASPPTFDEVEEVVEESSRKGNPVEVSGWTPGHAHWFARKQPQEQREDFFGFGGMFSLYLKDAPQTRDRQFPDLPRLMKTYKAYTPELEQQIQLLNALQDGFLAKSKKLFGESFANNPAYQGMLFALPLLNAKSFIDATPAQRETWFELFDAYCTESKQDRGILLASKNRAFDETLLSILESMECDGLKYRY